MELVNVKENEIQVTLDWADVRLLTYMIRHALMHDVGGTAADPTLMVSYADTAVAFLEAAGLASWAHTVPEEDYTLKEFAQTFPVTPEEDRAEKERWAAAKREKQPAAP